MITLSHKPRLDKWFTTGSAIPLAITRQRDAVMHWVRSRLVEIWLWRYYPSAMVFDTGWESMSAVVMLP